MRKLLNKALRPLGYELLRVDVFATRLAALLTTQSELRFVQIGAHDGVQFDDLYTTVTQRKCSGLAVEPLPDVFQKLCRHYADYPRIVPVNCAVHASAGDVEIYRVRPDALGALPPWVRGLASLDRAHLQRHGVPEAAISSERVVCKPLMQLLDEFGFADANLLQIDVEGYDAEVLRMIEFERFRPALIKYEHKNLSAADALSARKLLRDAGYRAQQAAQDTIAWLR
jgi:FkbM family methyltransferase